MARRIPEDRFDELVRAATEVFIERGCRRTQMSDIAEAVGVVKGTLYGYVESKDALRLLCLVWASDPGPIPLPEMLPAAGPPIATRVGDALAHSRLVARTVLENCVTWSVQIHWDRAPEIFDPAEARETSIDFLVRGLLAASQVAVA